jgi:hypothetical protein
LVERLIRNQQVAGSIPAGGSILSSTWLYAARLYAISGVSFAMSAEFWKLNVEAGAVQFPSRSTT